MTETAEARTDDAKDPRRGLDIQIKTEPAPGNPKQLVAFLMINGEMWCEIEWSEKRLAWCIQDAEGKCLKHAESTHATAESMDAALEIGEAMIRDGTMPSPELAYRERRKREAEQRAKRNARPSVAAKREERKALYDEEHALSTEAYEHGVSCHDFWADSSQLPLLESVVDALDVRDPDIWRSNSFAILREKLVAQALGEVFRFKHKINWERRSIVNKSKALRPHYEQKNLPPLQRDLDRAEEMLRVLDPDGLIQVQLRERKLKR